LVAVSICGKLFAFGSLLLLGLFGHIPMRAPLLGTADLLFALIFIWWWFDA